MSGFGKNNPMYGRHHSEEWKRTRSKQMSGKNNPFYGKHHTRKTKKIISIKKTGTHYSEEVKRRVSEVHKKAINEGRWTPYWTGKHLSEEHKKKLSKIHKKNYREGRHIPYWKGKLFSEEHKKKIGEAKSNEKNYNWKGDYVGIEALHRWIARRKLKPKACEMCNYFEPKELSNISGKYERNINDFQWLCHSCHKIYDKQIQEVIGFAWNERQQKRG